MLIGTLFGFILWLITALLLALVGGKLARWYGQPGWLGAVIGFVLHLPGILLMWVALAVMSVCGALPGSSEKD